MTTPTKQVGIREFRQKLSSYLLESEGPLAIMRHGDFIGYYIPAPRKRTEAERLEFREAATEFQKMLDVKGIDEEEILRDFKKWRKSRSK